MRPAEQLLPTALPAANDGIAIVLSLMASIAAAPASRRFGTQM